MCERANLGDEFVRFWREPEFAFLKIGAGGEGDGSDVARFEGAQIDEGIVGFGFDDEHVIDTSRDGSRTAENPVLIGVVDDEDGGIAGLGDAAQVAEDGLDGEDVVFVCTVGDVGKGIDNYEASAKQSGAVGDYVSFWCIAQVVASERDVVEWDARQRLMATHG